MKSSSLRAFEGPWLCTMGPFLLSIALSSSSGQLPVLPATPPAFKVDGSCFSWASENSGHGAALSNPATI